MTDRVRSLMHARTCSHSEPRGLVAYPFSRERDDILYECNLVGGFTTQSRGQSRQVLAGTVGFEPTTTALTVQRTTVVLHANMKLFDRLTTEEPENDSSPENLPLRFACVCDQLVFLVFARRRIFRILGL